MNHFLGPRTERCMVTQLDLVPPRKYKKAAYTTVFRQLTQRYPSRRHNTHSCVRGAIIGKSCENRPSAVPLRYICLDFSLVHPQHRSLNASECGSSPADCPLIVPHVSDKGSAGSKCRPP